MCKRKILTYLFLLASLVGSSIFPQIPDIITPFDNSRYNPIQSIAIAADYDYQVSKYFDTRQPTDAEYALNDQNYDYGHSIVSSKAQAIHAIQGSPPWSGYLVLEGGDDYAQAEDHTELDVGDESGESFTVEAWINFSTFSTANIVTKSQAYNSYSRSYASGEYLFRGLGFSLTPLGMVALNYTQYGAKGFWVPGWHHVAGVFDQKNGKLILYMDGKLQHSWISGGNLIANSMEALQIGKNVVGQIDEVRLSNTIRYADSTYTIPVAPFEPDAYTRALWHFDDSEGATQCHDVSGEDNLLTCYNGAHISAKVTVNDPNFEIPTDYQLYQNYPNPFNSSTTIKFSLLQSEPVTLKVYTLLGKEILQLLNENLAAGDHKIVWKTEDLNSGVYFYVLHAGRFVAIRKAILVR